MTIPLLVNIDVNDLDGAIQFYASAFGLRPGRRLFGNVAEMIGASSPIYLLEQRAGSPASIGTSQCRDYRRHWTPVHLDFVVEDIHGVAKRAQAAGAQLEGQIETHEWGYIANMADPFGNGFCLIEFIGNSYGEVPSQRA